MAVGGVEREHVSVGCTSEEPPVEIREAALHAERGRARAWYSTRHFSAHVAASIEYEFLSVVKYIVPSTTIGPACSADTSGNV